MNIEERILEKCQFPDNQEYLGYKILPDFKFSPGEWHIEVSYMYKDLAKAPFGVKKFQKLILFLKKDIADIAQ